MVSVTVLKGFLDLKAGPSGKAHLYRRADSSFVTTDERASEIASKLPGYITFEQAPEEAKPSDGADLKSLTARELKAIAAERGVVIPKNATKNKIISLLEE